MADQSPKPAPTFAEAFWLWLKVGLISFGGPAAQIAILQEELVERRGWVDQASFLRALNFCMLLPGPEAQQLATFMGLRLHGLKGALAAGILFVLPGAIVLFALAWIAAAGGRWPPLAAVFQGFLPVVIALIAHAVWRIGRRTLETPLAWAIALAAFVALGLLRIDFPWIIAAAIGFGLLASWRGWKIASAGHGPAAPAVALGPLDGWREARRIGVIACVFAVLWILPVLAVVSLAGPRPFTDVAVFFTKAAFVTFGGAYAVLPYVANAAVNHYGWLSQADMGHGLALAETTPGPLILVTQFVGFFAGWNASLAGHTALSPLLAGAIAAGLTTWVTFLPCFLFVLAGAPLVERIGQSPKAAGALSAITAAVVGVIATLGFNLSKAAFWPAGRLDPLAVAVALIALLALIRFKLSPLWLVMFGGLVGLARLWLSI